MFRFAFPTKIIYGQGAIDRIGDLVKEYGDRILLVTDTVMMQEAGYLAKVKKLLEEESHGVLLYNKVHSAADSDIVNKGADQGRHARCNVVVGFGGQTTLNVAKAIAFLISNKGNMEDYFIAAKGERKVISYIEIPSTHGFLPGLTYSFAVKDKYDGIIKQVENPFNYADMTIVDPKITLSLPKEYTGYIGLEILSLAVESFLSKGATPFSDAFAIKAIETLELYLKKAVQDPENLNFRNNLSIAGIMASLAVANSTPGSCYALALALKSLYGVNLGLASTILLPNIMEFNLTTAPTRYVQIAKSFGENVVEMSVVEAAIKAIDHVRNIMFALKVPQSLADLDISKGELEKVAKIAQGYNFMYYLPRPVSKDDLENILDSAME